MKKISLIALTLCAGVVVFAQETQPQLRTPMASKTRFGIRAGANLANFRANDFPAGTAPDLTMKTAFHGGLFANVPLGGRFAVQPGVEYSKQGSKLKVGATNYELDLNYVNVPIMFQLKTMGGLMFETGPQAGFLISAKQDGPGNMNEDVKEEFDSFDLSWGLGLGYLTRVGVGINARYNFGLTNTIDDGSGSSSNDGPELKNQVFQIGLVYHFGASK